jgi:PAS domain S-box-containing protein
MYPGLSSPRFLEGTTSGLYVADGYLYLTIGETRVRVREARLTGRLWNRISVSVLLSESTGDDNVHEVLAWRRAGRHRVHFSGMSYSRGLISLGAILCALGIPLPALLFVGCGVLTFQLALMLRMWWVLRYFVAHAGEPLMSPEAHASVIVTSFDRPVAVTLDSPSVADTPVEVPLELPLPLAAASMDKARTMRWPGEILEFTHDAIIIWEMDGAGIVYWNRAAEQLYGYTREQAHGRVTHELLKTELSGGVGELESKLARYGAWVGELRHTRSDGQRVEVEGRLSLMSQEHRPWLILEVNRDVTDRNRAEASRRAMEQQLRRLHGATVE